MKEIWKDIKGYEGLYQVSNYGRIKSLERIVNNNSKTGRLLKETIIKLNVYNSGYYLVSLWKHQKSKTFLVHRLVAQAFIPNPKNYPEVNHKDENKLNNFVYIDENGEYIPELSNLEWCTHQYNNNFGTRNKRSSISKNKQRVQYDLEGNFIKIWNSAKEIEETLGFKAEHISSCCSGKKKTAYGFIWRYI